LRHDAYTQRELPMGKEPLTFRVRRFNPKMEKFEDLLKIGRMIYLDPVNHMDSEAARQWYSANPGIFSVLVDNQGKVHAYSTYLKLSGIISLN
jgi:hypothetical protein